ncbi:MAG: hypothetical protein HQK60_16785 [Deltaproteobacteria bacterium]|nr:hypothetical protein [Deltaproteobacteria bacterium]
MGKTTGGPKQGGNMWEHLDDVIIDIFSSYCLELLTNSTNFILAAVWGTALDDGLTLSQQAINQRITTAIAELVPMAGLSDLDSAQELAVHYMIRETFVSKLLYMVEVMKRQQLTSALLHQGAEKFLERATPVGSA